jgi:hypothetical protein
LLLGRRALLVTKRVNLIIRLGSVHGLASPGQCRSTFRVQSTTFSPHHRVGIPAIQRETAARAPPPHSAWRLLPSFTRHTLQPQSRVTSFFFFAIVVSFENHFFGRTPKSPLPPQPLTIAILLLGRDQFPRHTYTPFTTHQIPTSTNSLLCFIAAIHRTRRTGERCTWCIDHKFVITVISHVNHTSAPA